MAQEIANMQQGQRRSIANGLIWAVLCVTEALQALILFDWLLHFLPIKNEWTGRIFPEQSILYRPEREGILFLIFVVLCVVALFLSPYVLGNRWEKKEWRVKVLPYLFVELLLSVLLLSALFKMAVYDAHPEFARRCYQILLLVAVLNKVFWPYIFKSAHSLNVLFWQKENQPALRKLADIAGVSLVLLTLYLPNPEAALGRMFIGEQLHHFDIFIMAPGWAAMSGEVLYKDSISQYGVGVPIVLGHIAQFFGGFTYLNAFLVIIWGCIIYYVLSYVFLRMWFGSITLAIAGILVAIRTNMFHPGVLPFAFTYPSATPIRYVWDILLFFCLFLHLRHRRRIFLIMAALICGFSTFYLESTGIFMTIAFYADLSSSINKWAKR